MVGLAACSPQGPAPTQSERENVSAESEPAPSGEPGQEDNSQDSEASQSNAQGSENTQVVEVEVYQFGWDPNPIRVEAGRPVRLELSSRDVAHGIGIPELGVSKQIPGSGETVTTQFTPEQTGEYRFICNVYCGRGHSAMNGRLIVE